MFVKERQIFNFEFEKIEKKFNLTFVAFYSYSTKKINSSFDWLPRLLGPLL
jgi:hypothetical protein